MDLNKTKVQLVLNVLIGQSPKSKVSSFIFLLPETCIVPGICQRYTNARLKIRLVKFGIQGLFLVEFDCMEEEK